MAFDDVDEYSVLDDPDQSMDISKRYVTPNVGMGARTSKVQQGINSKNKSFQGQSGKSQKKKHDVTATKKIL